MNDEVRRAEIGRTGNQENGEFRIEDFRLCLTGIVVLIRIAYIVTSLRSRARLRIAKRRVSG